MNPFFNVKERPLKVEVNDDFGHEIKPLLGKKLIYNADAQQPVSVVGIGYKLIPFAEVNERIEGALKRHSIEYEAVHKLEGGRKLFSQYQLLGDTFSFAPPKNLGDVSRGTIFTRNSYDSSSGFEASWGLFRLVCSNGAVRYSREHSSRAFHTVGTNYVRMIDQMIENLDSFRVMKQFYSALAEHEVSQIGGNQLIDKLIPDNRIKEVAKRGAVLPEEYGDSLGIRRKEGVINRWNDPTLPDAEKPRNLWTLYNAFTYVITHDVEKETTKMHLHNRVEEQFRQLVNA